MQNDLLENTVGSAEDVTNKEPTSNDVDPSAESSSDDDIRLPTDPTEWTSDNIKTWITWVTKEFKLQPPPDHSRFPSDGKELVEFTRADFWVCAGSKLGGNTLAKHLAYLQHTATGRCTSPLNNDNDPGTDYVFVIVLNSVCSLLE